MLIIQNLSKKYGKKTVLDDLNLQLEAYGIYGVLGRNGCGKSTLFKSIMGLITINKGKLLYNDREIDETQRHRFGYMPEQRSLLQDLSLEEHLLWLGKLKKMDETLLENRIQSLSKQFDLNEKLSLPIHVLSKGQQQKAQLLVMLLNDPQVLILDEPLNGLDMESVSFFMKQLKNLASQGKIILISSHQMEFMDELCTSFILLHEGKVIKKGTLDQFQSKTTVVVKLNSSCDWQALRIFSTDIKEMGAMIHFHFKSMNEASKLLSKTSKIANLNTLHLETNSIVNVFLDNA